METIILFAFTLFYRIFGLRNPPLPNQWLLVLNQDTTADDGYFDYNIGLTGIQNKDNPQSNAFSIVGGLNQNDFLFNGAYTFRIVYGGLSDGSSFDKTWTQSSWLMDTTITGSSLGEYDENNPNGFYGLGLSHGAFLDGNAAQHPNWWYAVGSIQPYKGGIPAIHGLVAKSVRLMVCAGENCNGDGETFECPLDGDSAVACPMPYNYPSCEPDCIDEKNLNGPGIYRLESTNQCYKTWDDCRNCIDQVDRRDIVDCDSGLPIEGFGFKVCSKERDRYGATGADFTIDYQVGMQRYSCDIINQPKAFNAFYTCKSAIPTGECFEEEDEFVQINMRGEWRDSVCIDAIIYDGKMLPTEAIRLGDDVHGSPSPVLKRRYNVRDGNVLRRSLPTGYESLELVAPQCLTMRVEVTACEWHDEAVGDLMMRISGSEGKGNYFSVNEATELPISGETKEYFFTSAVWDGIGKLDGVDLIVEDNDGYCISNVEVDTLGYWAAHGAYGHGSYHVNGANLDPECKSPSITEHDQSGRRDWVTGNMGYQCCSLDGSDDANRHGCTRDKAYTFEQAVANCAADNKRLCTMEEVEQRKGATTGCNFDATLVWTSTRCMNTMDFDANHFGNGIFVQPESLELQHNSRRRMLESEGEETELNNLRIVTIGSLMVVVLCMMVIFYYARVTSVDKKMELLDDGNSVQLQV